MATKKEDTLKTNVTRLLCAKRIAHRTFTYPADPVPDGMTLAGMLGRDGKEVFKTLVTEGASGGHYVFVLPVCFELDLKKAARAVGEKSIAMLPSKLLLLLTGYIHGGCSPIGMKKAFPTVLDQSAEGRDTILFSAGRVGCQVEMSPKDLSGLIRFTYADICSAASNEANE